MRLGKIILVIALLLTGFQTTSAQTAVANAKDQNRSVDYINPFIGTARKGSGGTMPCVNLPFAMTNFVAQTDQNKISRMPYVYDDHYIMGFLATHQPTVWMGGLRLCFGDAGSRFPKCITRKAEVTFQPQAGNRSSLLLFRNIKSG